MKKSINITFIILRLILGGMMVYGGIGKFTKPAPLPTKMITLSEQDKQELVNKPDELKIRNYIFGMKQSGFAWELLGVVELLGGLLLISQIFSFIGALVLLPVTIHIFFFHLRLEPNETGDLVIALVYLLINLTLIFREYKLFKPLLKTKFY
jgi:uncharacterized membrane protein YphA (DoxX/SURF4 family)